MNDADTIFIESTRDRHNEGAHCLLRWGAQEWYAPVADVLTTAGDLFTCAAYADLIGQFLRLDFPPHVITGLTTEMLRGRKPKHFGMPSTLYVLAAGSSKLKAGRVVLSRKNTFHLGKADVELTPDEARAMGRHWIEAAVACDSDTLFSQVLERAGWMEPEEMNALFGLLSDIRSGTAPAPR